MRYLIPLMLLPVLSHFLPIIPVTCPDIIEPTEVRHPFNGKNLDGFYTWQKETGRKDPQNIYSVQDGAIRIAGEGAGYLATTQAYKNYHLSVEYRWGKKTDGSGYVRNSGILLHGTGADGSAGGAWMASLEVQLAQGCEGDFIVIRGKDKGGKKIPVDITSNTVLASDKRTRWSPKGEATKYQGRQFWWSKHQAGFKEKVDTRGKDDVASPLGEWTKVECICRADKVTIKINGTTVNECYNVFPQEGRILLQNESNEVFFRNLEIRPLPDE
jgi:hypothetical protein